MKTAVILASGHSLTLEQIEAARLSGHFTIAVNTTYEKALWAHAMYAGDFMWFKLNIAKLRASKFKGKLVTQDSSAAAHYQLTRVRGTNRGGLGKEVIHMNGNSGVQAINLAFLWGYRRIILLGFDMKLGPKGEKHHHADHGHPAVQHQCFDEWLKKIQLVATDLVAAKCEVIDCTVGGALRCFPKGDWKEVLK